MSQNTGKYIILAGAIIMALGLCVYLLHDKFQWFGKLPGDIRVEKENFRFFFPITTMVLLSAVVNLILWLVRKFL
jgi:H+/Cl- antiporter ClcA